MKEMKKLLGVLAIGATVGVGGVANASPGATCDYVYQEIEYYNTWNYTPPAGYSSWLAYFQEDYPSCFSGSSGNAQAQISGTMFQMASMISQATSNRFLGIGQGPRSQASAGASGMAAGGQQLWNVWGNVANSDTRQSYTRAAGASIRNDSDIQTAVIGADYALSPAWVLGASAAFDRGDNSGSVNGGAANITTSKGYTIAPYLAWQINKNLSLDVMAGMGSGKLSAAGNSNQDSDRWFTGANLSYGEWFGDWQVTGKGGYLHGEEKFGNITANGVTVANTGVKNKIDRWQFGAQAGYWMGNGVMPYGALSYIADRRGSSVAVVNDPIGKHAWQWTLGVNFFSLANGVTGGVAYNQEEGRSSQKNNSLMANISIRF